MHHRVCYTRWVSKQFDWDVEAVVSLGGMAAFDVIQTTAGACVAN